MGYIDIAILVLLGIALIVGFIKGFKMKRIGFSLFVISIAVGYLAGVPLSRYLMSTKLGYDVLQNAYLNLLPKTDTFTAMIQADDALRLEQIKAGLTELKIPSFFQGIFTGRVIDYTSTVSTAIASSFSNLTLIASCFLIIFLLCFLLLRVILKPLWNVIFGENGKNFFGRVFGMLLSSAKVIFLILLLFIITSLINQLCIKYGYTGIDTFLNSDLKLEDPSQFSIGKFFYQTASSLLTWISSK